MKAGTREASPVASLRPTLTGEEAAHPRALAEPDSAGGHPAELKLSKVWVPPAPDVSALAVDRAFIEDALGAGDVLERVAVHHRSLFHARHGADVERAIEGRELVGRHIRQLQERSAALSRQLLRTDELLKLEREAEAVPWSAFDLAAAAGLGLFSLVLLAMGINTLATYVLDAGFVLFAERPALAYLFSALAVAPALLLKVGFSWCRSDAGRHRYFVSLWAAGLCSALIWLVCFALIFPDLGASGVDEILAGLESFSADAGRREALLEGLLVCAQVICEICISAALWIHLARMVREHSPSLVLAGNPEHRGYLGRLSRWNDSLREATDLRGRLEGRLKQLRAAESAFVSRAKTAAEARQQERDAERYGPDRGPVR